MFDFAINHVCPVDRALIAGGMFFDIFAILATVTFLFIFSKKNKDYLYHYFVVMIGVAIFEMFTSPLWNNHHLGTYAYFYQDVSWVLMFGWSTLILSVILLVDTMLKKYSEVKRFFMYLVGMSFFGFLAEALVVNLGLRTYSSEISNVLWGPHILNVPVEVFYYIPVFSALVIGFYKYWSIHLDRKAVVPEKNIKWGKSLGISVVAVILFELMVEPMAVNHMPAWSYVYHDISFIMTGIWIVLIWLSVKLVDKFFIHYSLKKRFGLYLLTGGVLSILLESFYVANGFRSYSESVTRDFIGLKTPLTDLPIEIFVAMPMYFALMIAFIRYWEIITSKEKKTKV